MRNDNLELNTNTPDRYKEYAGLVNGILAFGAEHFHIESLGPGAMNLDPEGKSKLNAFSRVCYEIDITRALTFALRDTPHLQAALAVMIREKQGQPLTDERLSRSLRRAVIMRCGKIIEQRHLEPFNYFRTVKQRQCR